MSRARTGSATVVLDVSRILAAAILAVLTSACITSTRPMTGLTKGMGASVLSIDVEGFDDRLTTFDGPDQLLNIGYRWPTFSLEGLGSFTRQGYEDSDASTSLLLGLQGNYYVGSGVTRPVIGLAGVVLRDSDGDESSTRPGAQASLGLEWTIAQDLALRFSAVFGMVTEDEDNNVPEQTFYGLRADFFGGLPTATPRTASDVIIRSGVSWHRIDPDGQDTRNTLRFPGASVGMYYEGWMNNQLRIGADFDLHRASLGDASQMSVNIYPAIEYDLLGSYRTGTSFRLRGITSLRYESLDNGSSDVSGTVFGYGAGMRVTMPVWRTYTGAFGLDYVMSGENEDLFSPEKNTLRVAFTLERALMRGP